MAYVTPIFDRTQTDINTRTTKAYFNVADWTRIYDNIAYINDMVGAALGIAIPFTSIATPTTATIPSATTLNILLTNLNQVREVSGVPDTLSFDDGWINGLQEAAITFTDVNDWERTIALIYNAYVNFSTQAVRYPRTGPASTGSSLTHANRWRHY